MKNIGVLLMMVFSLNLKAADYSKIGNCISEISSPSFDYGENLWQRSVVNHFSTKKANWMDATVIANDQTVDEDGKKPLEIFVFSGRELKKCKVLKSKKISIGHSKTPKEILAYKFKIRDNEHSPTYTSFIFNKEKGQAVLGQLMTGNKVVQTYKKEIDFPQDEWARQASGENDGQIPEQCMTVSDKNDLDFFYQLIKFKIGIVKIENVSKEKQSKDYFDMIAKAMKNCETISEVQPEASAARIRAEKASAAHSDSVKAKDAARENQNR